MKNIFTIEVLGSNEKNSVVEIEEGSNLSRNGAIAYNSIRGNSANLLYKIDNKIINQRHVCQCLNNYIEKKTAKLFNILRCITRNDYQTLLKIDNATYEIFQHKKNEELEKEKLLKFDIDRKNL